MLIMRVWGKIKMKKNDKIYFCIVNILIFIIFCPWIIKGHYSTDTYVIIENRL